MPVAPRVMWVMEQAQGRRGKWSSTAVKEFDRVWKVGVNLPSIGPVAVKEALRDVVGLFDVYGSPDGAGDPDSFVDSLEVSQCDGDNPLVYMVKAAYTTETGVYKFADANPLLRPWKYRWGEAEYQRTLTKDVEGNPILNSAGDKFANLTKEDSRATLTVTRIEQDYYPYILRKYKDALNLSEFFGYPPLMVKSKMPLGEDFWERGQRYYTLTYQFSFKNPDDHDDVWQPVLLQAGFHAKIPNPVAPFVPPFIRAAICDLRGTPYQTEQLLTAAGLPLAVGDAPVYTDPIKAYVTAEFSDLNLEDQYGP